jgi:hypothetical protein
MSCFLSTGMPCGLAQLQRTDAFEVHVTIHPLDHRERALFIDICRQHGWKAVVIELGTNVPVQPMTCSRIAGGLDDAHAHALHVQQVLAREGFTITRVKIEAAPWNHITPVENPTPEQQHPHAYFEYHAKLLLAIADERSTLTEVCAQFHAHLSRNIFKQRADGMCERFVTKRSSKHGLRSFEQSTQQIAAALQAAGYPILSSVIEYCVYDSNTTLDSGWYLASEDRPL